MCAMQGSFLNTVVSVLKRHVIVGSCWLTLWECYHHCSYLLAFIYLYLSKKATWRFNTKLSS